VLRDLIYLNAISLAIRCAHRIYFTTILYGWEHGLLSLPRMVVSNFINFMAVLRAWRMYLSYLFRGRVLAWDKTMHDFPTSTQLLRGRQRLGDLLHSWQALDEGSLGKALQEQTRTQMPLGHILVSNGWLDEETLAEAIAYQADLPRARLTTELVREHAGHLSPEMGTRYRAIYIGADAGGRPLLAVVSPLQDESLTELKAVFGSEPRQLIGRESEITVALRQLTGGSEQFSTVEQGNTGAPLLGDMLIQQGLLKRDVFDAAMQLYRPDRHGRVGDYLVEQGVITREVVERVVKQQRVLQVELSQPELQT
jgi:adsorption protein B